MNNPEIIFFDIDDTLYRKYTDTLRPSVAQAMHELKAKGILTAIATGRPEAAMPAKVKALIQECGIDMLVTINGQYISFRGKPLQSYPLDIADIETAINLLEQHKNRLRIRQQPRNCRFLPFAARYRRLITYPAQLPD